MAADGLPSALYVAVILGRVTVAMLGGVECFEQVAVHCDASQDVLGGEDELLWLLAGGDFVPCCFSASARVSRHNPLPAGPFLVIGAVAAIGIASTH